MPVIAPGTGASSWTPLAVRQRLGGWWDASDTSSLVHASGTVSVWKDLSGRGMDFGQPTATNQPSIGIRTAPNGRSVLDFDGVNRYMDTPFFGFSSTTLCVVYAYDLSAGGVVLDGVLTRFGLGSAGWRNTVYGSSLSFRRFAGSTEVDAGIFPTAGRLHVVISEFSNSSANRQYVNGQIGAAGNAGSNSLGCLRVGGNVNLDGDLDGTVGEILLFPSIIDADLRSLVTRYLGARWGIPLAEGGACSPPLEFT